MHINVYKRKLTELSLNTTSCRFHFQRNSWAPELKLQLRLWQQLGTSSLPDHCSPSLSGSLCPSPCQLAKCKWLKRVTVYKTLTFWLGGFRNGSFLLGSPKLKLGRRTSSCLAMNAALAFIFLEMFPPWSEDGLINQYMALNKSHF